MLIFFYKFPTPSNQFVIFKNMYMHVFYCIFNTLICEDFSLFLVLIHLFNRQFTNVRVIELVFILIFNKPPSAENNNIPPFFAL